MSGKKDGDEEDGDDSSRSRSASSFGKKSAKDGRNIRFELPPSVQSVESFSSALSQNIQEHDDYEDFLTPTPSIPHYFVSAPLQHFQPRKVKKGPCLFQTADLDMFLLPTASSTLLSEIMSDSPTPSNANLELMKASCLRKLEAVKQAIENGANVNTYMDGQTPLMSATEIGDHRLVAYLLTVPNINPDLQNYFGQTPLLVAVRNGFTEIVRLLLNHNADVNISDHMGKTPLHAALFQQRPNLAKLLLAYGADVEKPDSFGEQPIYTSAVKKPNIECLLTLLKMGAAVNYVNFSGISLLSRTILNGNDLKIVETLVQYGASVNSQDLVSKKTPLHFACLQDNVRVAKFLVGHGADVNLKTRYNFTPLDEALVHRSELIYDYLSEVMNQTRKKTIFGRSATEIQRRNMSNISRNYKI